MKKYSINGIKVTEEEARQIVIDTPKGKFVQVLITYTKLCFDGVVRSRQISQIYEGRKLPYSDIM